MGDSAAARWLADGRTTVWIVLTLSGVTIHLLLWQISEPFDLFSDFYKAYYPAAELLLEEGLSATWPLTEAAAGGFVNIPIIAWLFVPLVPLGEEGAGWAFLGVGAAATVAAWALLTRMGLPQARIGAPLLFLFLINGPLVNSLREGNTTHIILLLLIVALLLWRGGRQFAAGLVLGACAVLKLPLLLFGAYFILRRRWRIVAGGIATISAALVLSLLVYGVQGNIAWYKDSVEPFLGGVIPAFDVQSVDGFLMRLSTGASRLRDWDPLQPPDIHKVARLVLLAVLYTGAAWLLWRCTRGRSPGGTPNALTSGEVLEYALVLNLALVTSPISWTHYYLLLMMPWGLHLGGRLPLPDDRATRWLMRSSLALISLPVIMPALPQDWLGELIARTLVSAWFFGGLLMLASLARGLWHTARSARPET